MVFYLVAGGGGEGARVSVEGGSVLWQQTGDEWPVKTQTNNGWLVQKKSFRQTQAQTKKQTYRHR